MLRSIAVRTSGVMAPGRCTMALICCATAVGPGLFISSPSTGKVISLNAPNTSAPNAAELASSREPTRVGI